MSTRHLISDIDIGIQRDFKILLEIRYSPFKLFS